MFKALQILQNYNKTGNFKVSPAMKMREWINIIKVLAGSEKR